MGLRIVPLRVGHLTDLALTESEPPLPFFMFLIVGGREPILVDTGSPGAEHVRRSQGLTLIRPAEQEPAAALAAWDVDPADVRTIVLTHLHWDHSGNGALFPAAELVIQATELRYGVHPTSGDRESFDLMPGTTPAWLADIPRMRVIDGDQPIAPGIGVLHLPGHTPGFQGVLVDTDGGPRLLAGDTVPSYRHWLGDATRRHIDGTYTDKAAYRASLHRIDGLADGDGVEVVPSHDDELTARGTFA